MPKRGVLIETVITPASYGRDELDMACLVAAYLNRGKLVLAAPPKRASDA